MLQFLVVSFLISVRLVQVDGVGLIFPTRAFTSTLSTSKSTSVESVDGLSTWIPAMESNFSVGSLDNSSLVEEMTNSTEIDIEVLIFNGTEVLGNSSAMSNSTEDALFAELVDMFNVSIGIEAVNMTSDDNNSTSVNSTSTDESSSMTLDDISSTAGSTTVGISVSKSIDSTTTTSAATTTTDNVIMSTKPATQELPAVQELPTNLTEVPEVNLTVDVLEITENVSIIHGVSTELKNLTNNDTCGAGNPCENGGICGDMPGTCNCSETGYIGVLCDIDVDECETVDSTNCDDGLTCENIPGSFKCIPTLDSTSSTTNVSAPTPVELSENGSSCLCYNGGLCDQNGNCVCIWLYSGKKCTNLSVSFYLTVGLSGLALLILLTVIACAIVFSIRSMTKMSRESEKTDSILVDSETASYRTIDPDDRFDTINGHHFNDFLDHRAAITRVHGKPSGPRESL